MYIDYYTDPVAIRERIRVFNLQNDIPTFSRSLYIYIYIVSRETIRAESRSGFFNTKNNRRSGFLQ